MFRPSYRKAVIWIAENDNAGNPDALDLEALESYLTVQMVADLFQVETGRVAADIAGYRSVTGITKKSA